MTGKDFNSLLRQLSISSPQEFITTFLPVKIKCLFAGKWSEGEDVLHGSEREHAVLRASGGRGMQGQESAHQVGQGEDATGGRSAQKEKR